jgi:DNA-directed RNA polymerase specialized sigma24 family protein
VGATLRNHAADAEQQYLEFASAQAGQLFRIAYLMCGDWHEAQDLVQIAMAKLFVAWGRASRADNVALYARTVFAREHQLHVSV